MSIVYLDNVNIALSTGPSTYTGTAASDLGALSSAASGTVVNPSSTGTAGSDLGALSQAAAGTVNLGTSVGTAASSLGALSSAAAGTHVAPVFTGTAASDLGAVFSTATGGAVPTFTGTAASSLGALSSTAAGTHVAPSSSGTAASDLGPVASSAAGTHAPPAFTGTVGSGLGALTQSAAGTSSAPAFDGPAASDLGPLSSAAVGTYTPPSRTGTAASALGALSQAAAGQHAPSINDGTAASTLGAIKTYASSNDHISNLVDDFEDGVIDPQWDTTFTPVETGGVFQFSFSGELTSASPWSMVGQRVFARITMSDGSMGDGSRWPTSDDISMRLLDSLDPTGTYIQISVNGTAGLQLLHWNDGSFVGTSTDGGTGLLDGYVWFSFVWEQGLVYFEFSRDTVNWTRLSHTGLNGIDISDWERNVLLEFKPTLPEDPPNHWLWAVNVFEPTDASGTAASGLGALSSYAIGSTALSRIQSDLGPLSSAAEGTIADPVYTGTAASGLGALSSSAAGTHVGPTFAGDAASDLGALSSAATGTSAAPAFDATMASDLGALASDATGVVVNPIEGTADSTLGPLSSTASGTHVAPQFTGTIGSDLGALATDATGVFSEALRVGTIASDLASISADVTGTFFDPGTDPAASHLGALFQSATGTHSYVLAPFRYWNGTAWVAIDCYIYDDGEWIDLPSGRFVVY